LNLKGYARQDAKPQSLRIALAPMVTASFCGGVRRERFSGQRETASNYFNIK